MASNAHQQEPTDSCPVLESLLLQVATEAPGRDVKESEPDMDAYELTRTVYSRVQALEPDHASKIMGYLLLQDEGDQEMFRLAFSHDVVLQALVTKVKKEMGLTSSSSPSRNPSLSSLSTGHHFLSPSQLPFQLAQPGLATSPLTSAAAIEHLNSSLYHGQDDRLFSHSDHSLRSPDNQASLRFSNRFGYQEQQSQVQDRYSEHLLRNDIQLADHLSFLNEPHDSPYFSHDILQPDVFSILNGKLNVDNVHPRFNGTRRFSTSDLPMSPDSLGSSATVWKPCLYYARGFCKHGSNCKFLHSHTRPDSAFLLSPNNGQHDSGSDDGILTGSLERLEFELQELLRGRKAPISIASLPQLYYERFGKNLQADGYLTESQRHGKAGYSLTKLLARLKNSVTLIDRPHGQHAVVLAEDAFKFSTYRGEKDDISGVNPGSRQIYLTFPADSAFTEEDVSSYFRAYGPVQDVRIPYQQKRMFGFVTFVYPETVKLILAKGNPHYICGARVLVKPYKEKGKHADRKYPDREYPQFVAGQPMDTRAFDNISGPRFFLEHDALRRQLEEQEMIVEMERNRLAELQLEKQRMQEQHQHLQLQQQLLLSPPETSSPSPASVSASTAPSQLRPPEPSSPIQVGYGNGLFREDDTEPPEDPVDLKPIQTSSAFEFLVDGLDGNGESEDLESKEQDVNDKQRCLPAAISPKHNAIYRDEHNLPDSPFTSPHKPFSPPPSDKPTKSLAVGSRSAPPGFALPSPITDSLNCRICKDFYVDPVQLDCGHAFCVQCILKVIRVSKDECPICQRHIGSQIVKLIEIRRLQVVDIW